MKSGKPNEPKNKARLRMEALKAARGVPRKKKSNTSKAEATKKKVLPAKKATAAQPKSLSKSLKTIPKKKVSPVKKSAVSTKSNVLKSKVAAPHEGKASKARITAGKKVNRSIRSKKNS
jgi:hypothetical protein